MGKLHRSQLVAEIKENFPELVEELNKEAGLLSFELNIFCRFTMAKIGETDRKSVSKCYAIALGYYEGGNAELRDAIDTCYVEDLEFPSPKKRARDWAWEIFPEPLKMLHRDFHR